MLKKLSLYESPKTKAVCTLSHEGQRRRRAAVGLGLCRRRCCDKGGKASSTWAEEAVVLLARTGAGEGKGHRSMQKQKKMVTAPMALMKLRGTSIARCCSSFSRSVHEVGRVAVCC